MGVILVKAFLDILYKRRRPGTISKFERSFYEVSDVEVIHARALQRRETLDGNIVFDNCHGLLVDNRVEDQGLMPSVGV